MAGASPELLTDDKCTPLEVAECNGHSEIVTLIKNQIRWNRRKHLMMVLVENKYLPLASKQQVPVVEDNLTSTVLCDMFLVQKIVSFMKYNVCNNHSSLLSLVCTSQVVSVSVLPQFGHGQDSQSSQYFTSSIVLKSQLLHLQLY